MSRYSRTRRDDGTQWVALKDLAEFEEATRSPFADFTPPSADTADAIARYQEVATAPPLEKLDPVSCFKRSWFLIISDFLVLGGWTLLVAMAISTITLIPRAGVIIGAVLNNLLMCGIYLLFIRRMRGHRATFEDVTSPLRRMAPRIIIGGMVQSLVTAPLIMATLATASSPTTTSMLLLGVLFVPSVYLIVGYVFMLPLIADREMPIWTAMETSRRAVHRQWFPIFGLLLAAGMLLFVSAAALGVGLVLTLPLCTGALMYAYEDLFDQR